MVAALGDSAGDVVYLHSEELLLSCQLPPQGMLHAVGIAPAAAFGDNAVHDGVVFGRTLYLMKYRSVERFGIDALHRALLAALHLLQAGIVADLSRPARHAVAGIGTAAVGASDLAAQIVGVAVVGPRDAPSLLPQCRLDGFPNRALNDGWVSILVAPVTDNLNADVALASQQVLDRGSCPLPVGHTLEVVAHSGKAARLQEQIVGVLHYLCFLCAGYQTLWGLLVTAAEAYGIADLLRLVAEGDSPAAEVAFCHHLLHLGPCPLADHLGVHAVHQNGHLLVHMTGKVWRELLLHEFDTHACFFEQILGHMVGFTSRQAAHIGHHDHIEHTRLSISEELLPARSVQVRAGLALVNVFSDQHPAIIDHAASIDFALCVDGGIVAVLLVVGAAAQIDGVAGRAALSFTHSQHSFQGGDGFTTRPRRHQYSAGVNIVVAERSASVITHRRMPVGSV